MVFTTLLDTQGMLISKIAKSKSEGSQKYVVRIQIMIDYRLKGITQKEQVREVTYDPCLS